MVTDTGGLTQFRDDEFLPKGLTLIGVNIEQYIHMTFTFCKEYQIMNSVSQDLIDNIFNFNK